MGNTLVPVSDLDTAKRKALELKTEFTGAKKDFVLIGVEWGKSIAQVKAVIGHGNFIPWVESDLGIGRQWAAMLMRAAEAYDYLIKMEPQGYICEEVESIRHLALMRDDAKEGLNPLRGQRRTPKPPKPRMTPAMGSQAYQEDVAAAVDDIVDEREAITSDLQNEVLRLRERIAELEAEVATLRAQLSSKEET